MVAAEHARMVMATYLAADLSADTGEPVDLPLSNAAMAAIHDMTGGGKRAQVG
jgi:myo-inositol 2-dehydrogenase/D-chiro-inositol 1-dehydrogenase